MPSERELANNTFGLKEILTQSIPTYHDSYIYTQPNRRERRKQARQTKQKDSHDKR